VENQRLKTVENTAGLGFLALSLCILLTGLPSWSEEGDAQALSRGEVVIQQNAPAGVVPSVEAKILVPRSPEKVWPVVSNPERLMGKESKVKKVKVLSRTGNRQQVAFSVLMTRLFPPFNYVLQQDLVPISMVHFKRVSGSFKDIQGSWRLTPAEGGQKTILTYTLQLDPGPLIPRTLLLGAVKADLPNMMRNAKTAIMSSP
jgi:ribosome-associated toxin RatA of RatAB toxin-antitoxin module